MKGSLAMQHVAAGGAVDRGGLEQLPAVQDRLGIDLRRAPAGRADREVDVRRRARHGAADAADDRAADDARPDLEAAQRDLARIEAERAGEVVLVDLVGRRPASLRVEQLLEAAELARPLQAGWAKRRSLTGRRWPGASDSAARRGARGRRCPSWRPAEAGAAASGVGVAVGLGARVERSGSAPRFGTG